MIATLSRLNHGPLQCLEVLPRPSYPFPASALLETADEDHPGMSEPRMTSDTVTIVGAGLAGALLAGHLARAGHRVRIYERRPDPRQVVPERGRSINLALSTRGLCALRELGLADEVLKHSVPMRGRMIHTCNGRQTFQPYGKDDAEVLFSISRAQLNRLLIEHVSTLAGVDIFFEHRCTHLDPTTGDVEFRTPTGPAVRTKNDYVVGADGAFSAVRGALQRMDRFEYHQEFLSHGYKELTIPAGPNGTYRMEKNALHIWPRGEFMMIALPNTDGSFTCTLFFPLEGENSFAALQTAAQVEAFFQAQFPDVVPLLPNLAQQFLSNPTSSLVTIRCRPWHHKGRVVLLGDACHAVVPFLGQGMNAAFEDCTVLAECLLRHPGAHEAAFTEYEQCRREHTDALARLCVEHYQELRDRVRSRLFVERKRLGVLLHTLLPRWYLPLYSMVQFTRIPYAEAIRRARSQDGLVAAAALTALGVVAAGAMSFAFR